MLREERFSMDGEKTLTYMNDVGLALPNQGKYEEAESMNRQTLAQSEKVLGAEHLHTLMSLYCLAHILASHRYDEADSLYKRACAGHKKVLGDDHQARVRVSNTKP
jgi:hypothetical protein